MVLLIAIAVVDLNHSSSHMTSRWASSNSTRRLLKDANANAHLVELVAVCWDIVGCLVIYSLLWWWLLKGSSRLNDAATSNHWATQVWRWPRVIGALRRCPFPWSVRKDVGRRKITVFSEALSGHSYAMRGAYYVVARSHGSGTMAGLWQ